MTFFGGERPTIQSFAFGFCAKTKGQMSQTSFSTASLFCNHLKLPTKSTVWFLNLHKECILKKVVSTPLGTRSTLSAGTIFFISALSGVDMATTLFALFQNVSSQYRIFLTSKSIRNLSGNNLTVSVKCWYTRYSMVCSTSIVGMIPLGILGIT